MDIPIPTAAAAAAADGTFSATAASDADTARDEPALTVVGHPAVEAGVVVREHVVGVMLVRESIRAWDTGAVLLEGKRETT